jgi:uncharacterized protein YbjT (DUF2867 family)
MQWRAMGVCHSVTNMSLTVTLLGATGLVGRECLRLVLADERFDRVITLGRRALPPELYAGADRSKLTERVVDLDRLGDHADAFAVDRVICALGTTMKQAGSKEAFRRVDHEIPLEAARIALERGAAHYLLVSALGANAHSRVFYNRVKGEIEAAVLALPFRATTIVRPSLLVGERAEVRRGERIGALLGRVVPGRWRPVRASDVARVLVEEAAGDRAGGRIIESERIRREARAVYIQRRTRFV